MSNESADDRRSARANVLLRAVIESEGVRCPMKVGNLSAHGALVLGPAVLHEGAPMIFRCNGRAVEGWIAWACAGSACAGIQFDEPLEPKEFVRKPAAHTAIMRDSRELDFKR